MPGRRAQLGYDEDAEIAAELEMFLSADMARLKKIEKRIRELEEARQDLKSDIRRNKRRLAYYKRRFQYRDTRVSEAELEVAAAIEAAYNEPRPRSQPRMTYSSYRDNPGWD